MAETAARLIDHVFAPLPVRQWVLAVPKRLRMFLRRGTALQGAALRCAFSSPWCDAACANTTPLAPPLVRRGPIDRDDAPEMRACAYDGGFSVDVSVRIEGANHAGLERLPHTCTRPPFALGHLHQRERDAGYPVYRNLKLNRTCHYAKSCMVRQVLI